ncbi:hypothetical protein CIB48_g1427 [Xylaria polymorpha]|nr:hypothetical protein CIB48_g1427 [Xylaria polymorpha]
MFGFTYSSYSYALGCYLVANPKRVEIITATTKVFSHLKEFLRLASNLILLKFYCSLSAVLKVCIMKIPSVNNTHISAALGLSLVALPTSITAESHWSYHKSCESYKNRLTPAIHQATSILTQVSERLSLENRYAYPPRGTSLADFISVDPEDQTLVDIAYSDLAFALKQISAVVGDQTDDLKTASLAIYCNDDHVKAHKDGYWWDSDNGIAVPGSFPKRPCDGPEGRTYADYNKDKRVIIMCPAVWNSAWEGFDKIDWIRKPSSNSPGNYPIDAWEGSSLAIKIMHKLVHATDTAHFPGTITIHTDTGYILSLNCKLLRYSLTIRQLTSILYSDYFKGITGRSSGVSFTGRNGIYPLSYHDMIYNADSVVQSVVANRLSTSRISTSVAEYAPCGEAARHSTDGDGRKGSCISVVGNFQRSYSGIKAEVRPPWKETRGWVADRYGIATRASLKHVLSYLYLISGVSYPCDEIYISRTLAADSKLHSKTQILLLFATTNHHAKRKGTRECDDAERRVEDSIFSVDKATAGRDMSSGGFAARAQAAAAHNVNSGYSGQASQSGNQPSGQAPK